MMTRRPVRETAALLALVLTLAACGADNADESAPEVASPEVEAEAAAAPEPDLSEDAEDGGEEPAEDATADEDATAEGGGMGSVTVDGQTYEVTELRNCEPLDDGTIERSLELQGIGTLDGERFQIDVYQEAIAGVPFDDVSWSGPEGVFGGPEDAQIALDEEGERVSGTATLLDAMTQTDTLDIEFDLEVPAETIPCR